MKIKLANKIDEKGLELFGEGYDYSPDMENEDAILVRSASLHDYEMPKSLLAIARAGAGVNNIPIDRCSEAGIAVFNTPGANANAVKELSLCSLFLASRDIKSGILWEDEMEDASDFAKRIEKGKSAFVGPEIMGKKLGVLGLGAIGVLVANDAVKLGMEVYGYDPYISVSSAWSLSKWVKHVTDLNEVFKECDYITLHMPYTESTKDIIDEKAFSLMKEGVRIINLARGELVNEDALIKALESGKAARYVTDFASYRLVHTKNTVCFPHLGASTPESEENCAVMAVKELKDYLENGNIANSINLPAVSEPRSTSHRICLIHKNVPGMLAKLTSIIADTGINIENLVNKARGDLAYTMIDTNSNVDEKALNEVENIIRVRVIL